ncbi:hypothetical protein TRVA0_013S02322 [Trichomonascus vanleenenianus]|uniref:uncharacterized protein n=1 Tax=Trichomonascus vanleenenianus TaxID=2268995 RepID=UPI003EC9A243
MDTFDAFSEAQSPEQYMKAPASAARYHRQALNPDAVVDIANLGYYALPAGFSTADTVSLNYFVQSAVAFSKGFSIVGFEDLSELKKQQATVNSRIAEASRQLSMEIKMRDAASSMIKLHSGEEPTASLQQQQTSPQRKSLSFLGGGDKNKKRLSRQASEEMENASRRIGPLQAELIELYSRKTELDSKVYEHYVAILALTHQGSQSSASSALHDHLTNSPSSQSSVHSNGHGNSGHSRTGSRSAAVVATERMINQRHSRTATNSSTTSFTEADNAALDRVIAGLQTVAAPTMAQGGRIPQIQALSESVVRQFTTNSSLLAEKDIACEELRVVVRDTIHHLDPHAEAIPVDGPVNGLKSRVFDALARFEQQLHQEHIKQQLQRDGETTRQAEAVHVSDDKAKQLLKQQLESITSAYETNRLELERLEVENVELKTSLRDATFKSQAERQELNNELKANQERVQEWKERCESLKAELESILLSLENLTRQTVEYESDRNSLESRVQELEAQLEEKSAVNLDKRVSMIAPPSPPSELNGMSSIDDVAASMPRKLHEPISVTILRSEFRKIIKDLNDKHNKEIKGHQNEKKRLESLLRSIKTSSYAATLPPGTLESLGYD